MDIKRIKMCYVHVPIPCDECNHYVLQTNKHNNKKGIWKGQEPKTYSCVPRCPQAFLETWPPFVNLVMLFIVHGDQIIF